MEEAQGTQASRRGHRVRAHLTKLVKRIDEIMANENSNDMDMATLQSTAEQLEKKKAILQEIDTKIVAQIEVPEELEKEIVDSEEIKSSILEKIWQIRKFFELKQAIPPQQSTQTSPSTSFSFTTISLVENQQQASPSNLEPPQVSPQNLPSQEIPTQTPTLQANTSPAIIQPSPSFSSHTRQNTSRLPKLSLPTFNGNPLQWQTF